MQIYDCKVNHLTNPLGFRMTKTVFSWKVKEAVGKRQREARIRIAADADMTEILNDTGWSSALDSLASRVDVHLQPVTRYYWTVSVRSEACVKNDEGEEKLKDAENLEETEHLEEAETLEEAVSSVQWFETGKREQPWSGKWITCNSGEPRHPIFEKEISLAKEESDDGAEKTKEIEKARLYICGLGLYEAYYNGERIGDEYLTPYSNDYSQWIQYQTLDVTELIKKSAADEAKTSIENIADTLSDLCAENPTDAAREAAPQVNKLSILLGNGWYKGRFGFSEEGRTGYWGKEWKLIAELHLFYKDGTHEVMGTDDSWMVRRSNITFSNLYDGEWRDDTLEELTPEQARLCTAPEGALTDRMSLPVKMQETFEPVELIHTPAGEEVLDLGQEFAGMFTLRVQEPRGAKIHIRTGEVMQNGNFYNDNLRSAKSEYIYISDGREHILRPHFTYYGYRYVKIEGVRDLKKEDFTGIALYSEMKEAGQLKTGNALVNRLVENARWGLKSNFIDVPTDCPQRDERLGWTGDAQVFSPTATYLEDTYAFYAKYLYDMGKEQSHREGKVPDVVPSPGLDSTACVWGDSACIMPWNLYLFYGDKSILEDQFDSMQSWVEYIRKIDGDDHGWRCVFHYGDWLALDNPNPGPETVLGGTDEEFIANLYYAISAGLVAKAAGVLGKDKEQEAYQKLSDEQFDLVKNEYYSPTGRCCIKTQTALLLTLKYHLSCNEELVKKQLRKLYDDNNGKLKTGFVGTPLMCNILSDHGMEDIAYGLLLNEEYPGWLYEVKLGATTIWERWNSLLGDGTISGIGMNSMNHYSYGSIVEWMFRHGAGINTMDGAPGLRVVSMEPTPNWEIRSMEGTYDSACGTYQCSWKLVAPDEIRIKAKVPFGGKARLRLPYVPEQILQDKTNPVTAHVENGLCILDAGTYEITYKTTRSLRPVYSLDSTWRELWHEKEIREFFNDLDWNDVPQQYLGNTVKETVELFPFAAPKEKVEKLEEFLKKFNEKV